MNDKERLRGLVGDGCLLVIQKRVADEFPNSKGMDAIRDEIVQDMQTILALIDNHSMERVEKR